MDLFCIMLKLNVFPERCVHLRGCLCKVHPVCICDNTYYTCSTVTRLLHNGGRTTRTYRVDTLQCTRLFGGYYKRMPPDITCPYVLIFMYPTIL